MSGKPMRSACACITSSGKPWERDLVPSSSNIVNSATGTWPSITARKYASAESFPPLHDITNVFCIMHLFCLICFFLYVLRHGGNKTFREVDLLGDPRAVPFLLSSQFKPSFDCFMSKFYRY